VYPEIAADLTENSAQNVRQSTLRISGHGLNREASLGFRSPIGSCGQVAKDHAVSRNLDVLIGYG
jgi:hypothetical protein